MSVKDVDLYDILRQRYAVPGESHMVNPRIGATHVLVSGDPSAPPLVLLHGSGLNALMWAYQYAELNRHYRVYAVEIPGHSGKSVRAKLPTGHGAADWLSQTLDALNINEPVDIIGFSLGGWVTLRFAVAYPERIHKMTLLAPGGILPVPLLKVISYAIPSTLTGKPGYRRFVRATAVREYDPETLDALASMLQRAGFFQAVVPIPLSDAELSQIRLPTLLIVGSSDFFFPPEASVERVCRLMPHTRIHQLPDCEHAIPFDQPELMMELILDFFQPESQP
ncbi:MAG TPA: alpha/beta hydrolase [Phototrophicaceae bacterium]|jgi:pimeloyl-ACP methyl ester carboxylesterase|nr:alpha/beta hydrolase [Phototrophicaceae bacterium]